MEQAEVKKYHLDETDWLLVEDKYIEPPTSKEEDFTTDEGFNYMLKLENRRKINIASGTETQWKEKFNLVEGIDFYIVQENPEPNVEEVAYPVYPVFTLDEMIQAFEAGFECHANFLMGKEEFKKLYFKKLKIILDDPDAPPF
jgi:hypothetical protein